MRLATGNKAQNDDHSNDDDSSCSQKGKAPVMPRQRGFGGMGAMGAGKNCSGLNFKRIDRINVIWVRILSLTPN
jgi:hypothetical protein